MLRVIHAFDVKPEVQEASFIEWLDARLDEVTKRFGCLQRKTWVFIDGIQGDYEHGKPESPAEILERGVLAGPAARRPFPAVADVRGGQGVQTKMV